ncbi:MAG: ABC transporter substrate-binding protein [Methanosarcina sp.]|nr:ABC transporter substrate-binding protein [Methanosarcina sp.]MDD3874982.1 ABC transporter substrate-binding protein [Methanosarcina sp.]MDD4522635.1 ABC transporter substrate-binding protein [Methanosarcina sp.]
MKLKIITVLLAISIIFSGCVSQSAENTDVVEEETTDLKQEVTVPVGDRELFLDPLLGTSTSWHTRPLIFDTLLVSDREGIHPALASSVERTEDGKTWIFHLLEGVKFYDGTPFDAYTASYSLNKSFGESTSRYGLTVESIEVVDNYTLNVTLGKPFGPFLDEVAAAWMVCPNCYDSEGKFKEAIGTGAFVLEKYSKEEITLRANPDYWGGAPKIQKITVKAIPDASTQVIAFEAGELDVIGADISGIGLSDGKRFGEDPRYEIYTRPDAQIDIIGFNVESEFFSDKRIREAVSYGIDRQELIDSVLEGYGVPALGPIGYDASIPWTNTEIEGYDYDPETAAELLKEAGWADKDGDGIVEKDGKPFEINLIDANTRPYYRAMTEVIQAQLLKIGVKVNIRVLERGAYQTALKEKDFDMVTIPNYGKRETDPYPYLFMFFCSKGTYPIMNNETFNGLYFRSLSTVDPEQREALYDQMQEVIMDECVCAFLMHPMKVGIAKKELKNFELRHGFDGFIPLKKAYFSEE